MLWWRAPCECLLVTLLLLLLLPLLRVELLGMVPLLLLHLSKLSIRHAFA